MFNESIITMLSMIGLVHMVALISPGPDFAMILRSSAQHGKRYAMFSALGLGLGVVFHTTYSLLGLNVLIHTMPYVMRIIAVLGSIYLFYQGYLSIAFAFKTRQQAIHLTAQGSSTYPANEAAAWVAISNGFLTNVLNPKAVAYFFSFFAAVIANMKTPYLGLAAGVEIFLLTWGWFSFLAHLVSSRNLLTWIQKHHFFVNLSIGLVFILFSISMIVFTYT